MTWPLMKLSRRHWMSLAAGAGAARLVGGTPAPLFEEIPPAASGITWIHDNAMSEARYLPEALGPGCAFLDYDNDGWMDIYLVNSGACDFFKPAKPLRNALYKNNRDGTFTDVTEKSGSPAAHSEWASRSAITTMMAGRISLSRHTVIAYCTVTIATVLLPM